MERDDPLESFGGKLDDERVAHGNHIGGARLSREEAHLADALAGLHFGDHGLHAVAVRADDLQPSADHDAQAVARIALLEERFAAHELDPLRERLDRRECLFAQ
jgi:hypothetical protein